MRNRVALYVRVSTEEQAEQGYSIDAQIEVLKQYAQAQGWEAVATYVDDGRSAKNMDVLNSRGCCGTFERDWLIPCLCGRPAD